MTGNHVYGKLYRGFESLPLRRYDFIFVGAALARLGATRRVGVTWSSDSDSDPESETESDSDSESASESEPDSASESVLTNRICRECSIAALWIVHTRRRTIRANGHRIQPSCTTCRCHECRAIGGYAQSTKLLNFRTRNQHR